MAWPKVKICGQKRSKKVNKTLGVRVKYRGVSIRYINQMHASPFAGRLRIFCFTFVCSLLAAHIILHSISSISRLRSSCANSVIVFCFFFCFYIAHSVDFARCICAMSSAKSRLINAGFWPNLGQSLQFVRSFISLGMAKNSNQSKIYAQLKFAFLLAILILLYRVLKIGIDYVKKSKCACCVQNVLISTT